MTADEIRTYIADHLEAIEDVNTPIDQYGAVCVQINQAKFLAEIAAQLAEFNANLVKLTSVLEANSSGGQFDVKVWER